MQRSVYAGASKETFLEGHPEAFEVLGAVPSRRIRYDNLRPAVKQVRFGRNRRESFTDPRLCAAVADRLAFKYTLIETGSDSYRLAATEAEHNAAR